MDIKKLAKIIKNFESLSAVYDGTGLDWYVVDEEFRKEPYTDRSGETQPGVYDWYLVVSKIVFDDGLEEGDELLKELMALRAGDTLTVKSIVYPEWQKDFVHSEKEDLKVKDVRALRNSKNLYEVFVEIKPIEILYKEQEAEDPSDFDDSWKDER